MAEQPDLTPPSADMDDAVRNAVHSNFMTAPAYTLEGLLKARRVQHAGHPVLRWNIGNVEVKRDEAGRLRPVKPRVTGSHRKRIDGVVALLMGLAVLTRQPAPEPERQYQIIVLNAGARSDGWG